MFRKLNALTVVNKFHCHYGMIMKVNVKEKCLNAQVWKKVKDPRQVCGGQRHLPL